MAVAAPDPYGYYERLGAERPFAFEPSIKAWVAASAPAVEAALAHPALSVRPAAEPVPKTIVGATLGDVFGRLARMNDGERHRALRDMVCRRINGWTARAVSTTAAGHAQLLSKALATGSATLHDYLHGVPALTVASLIGLHEVPALADLIGDFARAFAPGADQERADRGDRAVQQLAGRCPAFESEDARANAIGLLFQSYEATAALVGNTLALLMTDETLQAMASRDGAVLEGLLERVARYDPPVHNTRRFAAKDAEILGQAVRAGDAVLVVMAAANRDPRATHSYSFGFGPHTCPGMSTAVSIARTALRCLLEAQLPLSHYAVAGYHPSLNVRSPILLKRLAHERSGVANVASVDKAGMK